MACVDAADFLEKIKNEKIAALGSNEAMSWDVTDQKPTQDFDNISAHATATPVGVASASLVGKSPGIPGKGDHQTQGQIQGDSSLEQEVRVSESLARWLVDSFV
ncbi:MAG: hypothetical protein Q9178_001226 [Gyalolechia marmorata]